MTGPSSAFDRVLAALDRAGRRYKHDKPNHIQASCPGPHHERGDLEPSLSITYKPAEGKVLMYCHVCGVFGDMDVVRDALSLTDPDLFDEPISKPKPELLCDNKYPEHRWLMIGTPDNPAVGETWFPREWERGIPIAWKVRQTCRRCDARKFHWRQPDDRGSTKKGKPAGVMPLGGLPDLVEAIDSGKPVHVYLTEGDSDAAALRKLGMIAVSAGGVNDWKPEHIDQLDGVDRATFTSDADKPGRDLASRMRGWLTERDITHRVVEPIDGHKDVREHLEAEHTLDELVAIEVDDQPNEPGTEQDQTEIDRRYLALRGRLLDAKGLRKIPPPTPLIEGWLFKDSLGWIQGKWGNAKTFAAVGIGCCVSTGTDWHGHAVARGRVLYLIAEGASGLSQRVDAWEAANGREATGIIFLPVPIRMADPYGVDVAAFRMLLVEIRPVLTIIDTQARVTVGAEENSSKDMGLFVDGLELLRSESGSTMLPIHHEPRNGENLRGSVALEGAADTIMRVSKDGNVVTVTNTKQKNAPAAADLTLGLVPSGPSAVLSHEAVEVIGATTESEERILTALWESFGSNEATNTKLLKVSDLSETTYYRSLKSLVGKGKLLKREQGRGTYYRLPHEQEEGLFDE